MDPKSLTRDFKEFLQSLNDHGVEYLVIGGHAVACDLDGVRMRFISLSDLKANKRASGRKSG